MAEDTAGEKPEPVGEVVAAEDTAGEQPEPEQRVAAVARRGQKVVVAGPWTPRRHTFKDVTAEIAMSQLATHLRVLDTDAALLPSQSLTAGSLPSPTAPTVSLVQPRALSITRLSGAETPKVVRSVAARVHHCDELLDMLLQEAAGDVERRSELQGVHRELTKQLNKHRDILVRCADGIGLADEVAELLHDTLPLTRPKLASCRAEVPVPPTCSRVDPPTMRLAIVGDAEPEGGGRRWSPSSPPSTAGGLGSRSCWQHRCPIGSAESFAARPHTASSKLSEWTEQHPLALKYDTRPRKQGLAQTSTTSVSEQDSLSSWRLDSTSSVALNPEPPERPASTAGTSGSMMLGSVTVDASDLEKHRRSRHAGSWRGPRATDSKSSGRRSRRKGASMRRKKDQVGGEDCAAWQMAVQETADQAAEVELARANREVALSKINFRNGEPMVLTMPRAVSLHCNDGTGGGRPVDAESESFLAAHDDQDEEQRRSREHGVVESRDGINTLQHQPWVAPDSSYSKSNLLSKYEQDQVRQRGDISLRFLPESALTDRIENVDRGDPMPGSHISARVPIAARDSARWDNSSPNSQYQRQLSQPLPAPVADTIGKSRAAFSPPHTARGTSNQNGMERHFHTSPPIGFKHPDGSVRVQVTYSMEQCWAVQDYLRRPPEAPLSARVRACSVAPAYPYNSRGAGRGVGRGVSSRGDDALPQRQRCLSRAEQIQCAIRPRPTAHASATKWPARSAAVALA